MSSISHHKNRSSTSASVSGETDESTTTKTQHYINNDEQYDNYDDVYMVRHSARIDRDANNRHQKWTPLPGHSHDDAHLSVSGERASQQLCTKFQNIHIAHIVSSPYLRCIQTVAPIARAKNIPIKIEPGICEVLTSSANYPPGFKTAEQLAPTSLFPNLVDVNYRPVMSKEDLRTEHSDENAAQRSQIVVLRLRKELRGPILFCGHGASCLGIAQAFGSYEDYVGYTSISHFSWNVADQQWNVKIFGDVSHLSPELQKQSLASAW